MLKLLAERKKVIFVAMRFSLIYAGLTGFSVSVMRALLQTNLNTFNRRFNWRVPALDCWSLTL